MLNVLDKIEHADQQAEENTIGWLGWREEWQHLTAAKRKALIKQHKSEIDFFAWLQWLTEQQLNDLKHLCQKVGMRLGIYGDLAVNSSRGSVDVWSQPELYCVKASVGAPPDPTWSSWSKLEFTALQSKPIKSHRLCRSDYDASCEYAAFRYFAYRSRNGLVSVYG